jgi:1,4-dihydroxy-2-naphthoate polyprenyltransferase
MDDNKTLKSIITCDMEGRIETFNDGAEQIFGYRKEEIIGKRRVSLFSPGKVVLQYVSGWLTVASEEGEYQGKTVFLRRDGTPFAAQVRITPTFKDGEQVGYCGVTEVLHEVDPAEVAPNISRLTKAFSWMVITRAPFLTAIIIPILIGAAWVGHYDLASSFPWGRLFLTLFSGIFMHISANTFNDYFDWTSGTDLGNNDYFLPYSGGSRSIELGLISERALFRVASISLLLSATMGLALVSLSGPAILSFGLVGAFLAYFYTAPPLRLAARRGLGELSVGVSFGPMATAGTVYALTGQVALADFWLGVPIGLLTVAILWINQFPDEEGDRAAGKINLVVVLGKERARWGYLALIMATFGLTGLWAATETFPVGAMLILGAVPLAYYASRVMWHEYSERTLIRANVATIELHVLAGLLMVVGLIL